MDRQFYIDLAHGGLRMPIGTDLVLSEKPDHAQIVLDGARLGSVIAESAARWRTPLAVGLMDLTLEKTAMLEALGLGDADPLTHHFTSPPPADAVEKITAPTARFNRQFQAHIDAVTHVARNHSELVPVGMSIGPFSLMTKLLADPLTPVFLAGSGLGPEDEESMALMLRRWNWPRRWSCAMSRRRRRRAQRRCCSPSPPPTASSSRPACSRRGRTSWSASSWSPTAACATCSTSTAWT